MLKFNVNNYVWVRLTPLGRTVMENYYGSLGFKWTPETDQDGWSKFQMWELIRHFGDYCYNGVSQPPFETTIRFENDDLIEVL